MLGAFAQRVAICKVSALNDEAVGILSVESFAASVGLHQQCGVITSGFQPVQGFENFIVGGDGR